MIHIHWNRAAGMTTAGPFPLNVSSFDQFLLQGCPT